MQSHRKRTTALLVSTLTTIAAVTLLAILASAQRAVAQQASTEQPDKYTWLEDIYGERQLAWVKAQNARTAAVMEKDSNFAPLEADALKVLESPVRLPEPDFRDGAVYNMWRDADHVRGIVRRTTLKDYLTPDPKWETVLDYDALAKTDKESWVAKGLHLPAPGRQAMPGGVVGGRRGCGNAARNKSADRQICRGRFCAAARQTDGGLGRPRHAAGGAGLGPGNDERGRLSGDHPAVEA